MVISSERRQLESSYQTPGDARRVLAASAAGLLIVLALSLAGVITRDEGTPETLSVQSVSTGR